MNIPFFDYPSIYKRFELEFDSIFKDVCSRGAFILQKDLKEFEESLADYLDVKHVLGVADGTNAMLIGFKALGFVPGDEVIISPHTYVATAGALHMAGVTPVFADIGDDGLLSASCAETKITERTRAVMPTQVNGRCADMDSIKKVAKDHGILVLEDSAQGLGARYKGQSAGTFGPFGTLSFYPAKLIGCFGDGGAVMTNDDEIAQKLTLWRDHGRDDTGSVMSWGTNSRLDNLQAAFLKLRLKHFAEDVSRRRQIARTYHESLSNIEDLYLPSPPVENGNHFDVYQNYELASKRRDDLMKFLKQNGIGTLIQWAGVPVHHFTQLGFGKNKYNDLPKADKFF